MDLSGAVVLITGASSGIGAATAHRLAAAGARVLVHGRDQARVSQIAAALDAYPLVQDLSLPGSGSRLAEKALQTAGRVDVLVSNAGVGFAGGLAEMSEPQTERLVSVNLLAPMELTRSLLPRMGAAGRGSLIYVTSIAGRTGVAGEAVYAATKSGLDGFAESLRFELAGTGVRVGVVVPGVVDTPFFDRRGRPYRRGRPRPVAPGLVAETIEQMIRTGRAERYVPRWLALPAGLRVTVPAGYRWLAGRFGGS